MYRTKHLIAMSWILVASACGHDPVGPDTSALQAGSSQQSAPNFHPVAPGIFRSGHLLASSILLLRQNAMKTILSLEDYGDDPQGAQTDRAWAEQNSFTFIHQPMDWHNGGPDFEAINAALAVISRPSNQPIIVHCRQGKDRTGIVIAAYRVKYQNWTVEAAVQEMHQLGMHSQFYSWDRVLTRYVQN